MREDVVVEVHEGRLLVGVGVVEERLQAGVIGGAVEGDQGGGDFGAPLVEAELDVGDAGVELGPHGCRLVLAGVGHFFPFEGMLDVDQAGEAVQHRPKIRDQSKKSIHAGHGR